MLVQLVTEILNLFRSKEELAREEMERRTADNSRWDEDRTGPKRPDIL